MYGARRGPYVRGMGRRTIHRRHILWQRLIGGAVASLGVSMIVIVSAWRHDSALGAPALWPWLLTGLQVLSLWAAGRRRWWAWLLGGSVQLPWIAYAVMTAQIGFIPGCAISAAVQIYSFLRNTTGTSRLEAMA
jgi:hypothetical protein